VLRISPHLQQGGDLSLKLEGQLLAPWIGAVCEACAEPDRRARGIRLDLAAVTYVDSAGFRFLRELIREGVEIGGCSRFVAESLHRMQGD
jgi:ABC-type transporter Mla MlaB component